MGGQFELSSRHPFCARERSADLNSEKTTKLKMQGCRSRSGGGSPQGVDSPLKRRSERKSGSENQILDIPALALIEKRSITVRKILPRKTLPSHVVGEPRSSPRVLNSTPVLRCSPRVSSKAGKENTEPKAVKCGIGSRETACASIVLSTTSSSLQNSVVFIDPVAENNNSNVLSPIPVNALPCLGEEDSGMAKKVRRSYSRLEMSLYRSSFATESHAASQEDSSDTSTPNQSRLSRRSFFGFDNLLSQEVLANVSPVAAKTGVRRESGPDKQAESSAIMSHTVAQELETNIPGIAMAKERRKRRKIPQIEKSDLDQWAAQMNAQFEEAENFDLLVE
ncbi:sororin isoform X2 [Lissotriton helveticus]